MWKEEKYLCVLSATSSFPVRLRIKPTPDRTQQNKIKTRMHSETIPAHDTKHLKSLVYPPFVLAQSNDGHSNGTALWLGGQILSFYLTQHLKPPAPGQTRPRAVELGSGVGLTACVCRLLAQ